MNDLNSSFVKSFQSTNAFRSSISKGVYPHFEKIVSRIDRLNLSSFQ